MTHGASKELQVIGVVRDAVYESLREVPPPTMYVPFNQRDARTSLILYAPGMITEVASSIRRDIQPKLGGKPLRIRTFTSQLETSLVRERLMATVAGTFGALALVSFPQQGPTLSGVVSGPDGPVSGATVFVARARPRRGVGIL